MLAFLFDKPTHPRDREYVCVKLRGVAGACLSDGTSRSVLDILQREAVDSARRQARLEDAYRSLERFEGARQQSTELQRDVVFGEGLDDLSETLRTTAVLRELPPRFRGPLQILLLQ